MGASSHSRLLERSTPFILDGGLGTSLEDLYGIKFSQSTPLWSSHLLVSDPELLRKLQKSFVEAGADIILTPTYQASHAGFRKTVPGISDDEIVQYFQSAVEISRSICNEQQLVALSLGAYGATLQPSQEFSGLYGDMDEDGLVEFHGKRIEAFDLSKVDIVAFETLPRLNEIHAVKKVVDGSKPHWITCVFPDKNKLPDGSTIEEVLTAMMADPKPWAIGINCTKIDKLIGLVDEFEAMAKKLGIVLPRLALYPDGTNGSYYDSTKQIWVGKDIEGSPWHEKLYAIYRKLQERNAWKGFVLGGCCKTTPEYIKRLHNLVVSS